MDTLIERKKRFTPRRIYGGAGVLFILVFVFYFIFRDTGSSMTIDKSRITIATVTENEFNDYVRVIGQVLPSPDERLFLFNRAVDSLHLSVLCFTFAINKKNDGRQLYRKTARAIRSKKSCLETITEIW